MEVVSAKDIVVGKDGIPVDKLLRGMTMQVIVRLIKSYPIGKDEFRRAMFKSCKKFYESVDCPILAAQQMQLAKALIASDVIIEAKYSHNRNEPYYKLNDRFLPKKPETHAERIANFEVAVRGMAERMVDDKAAQDKAYELIKALKRTRSVHAGKAGRYNAVICPSLIDLTRNGVRIRKAVFAVLLPNGCKFFEAEGNAIKLDLTNGNPVTKINLKRAVPNPYFDALFNGTIMMTIASEGFVRGFNTSLGAEIKKIVGASLSGINRQRALFSSLIGTEVSEKQWASSLASIRKGFKSVGSLRWLISQFMDKEARRLAHRRASFLGRDYNWFLDTTPENRKRRRQASDAFPALLQILTLKKVTAAIDAGQPLIPVLSEVMGLQTNKIKKFSGLTRVRLSKPNVDMLVRLALRPSPVGEYLSSIPVDYFHTNKDDFPAMIELADSLMWYGYPFVDKFQLSKVASNLDNSSYIFHQHIKEPARSTGEFLDQLVVGYFDYEYAKKSDLDMKGVECSMHLTRIIFEEVVGEQFSKKRAARFNALWHRYIIAISVENRNFKREARGDLSISWAALEDDFSCDDGELRFLTSDDALHAEGLEMSHCVSGYYSACLTGKTHIAAIHARDDSRSTVEFRTDGGINAQKAKIKLSQHKSNYNQCPSNDCQAVLAAFIHKYSNKEYLIIPQAEPDTYINRYEREQIPVKISDEKANEFLRMFDPMLPDSLAGKDIDWWRARVRKEQAKNISFYGGNLLRADSADMNHMDYYCDESRDEITFDQDLVCDQNQCDLAA